jgi:hypothetical protein
MVKRNLKNQQSPIQTVLPQKKNRIARRDQGPAPGSERATDRGSTCAPKELTRSGWVDGGGEVGGEGAEAGGEVGGSVGERSQRILVVVAREVGPRDGHQTLRVSHVAGEAGRRRRHGRLVVAWEKGKGAP